MEMTTTAHPQATLQVVNIEFVSLDVTSINKFITLCVQNAEKWASEGWGGYIAPGAKSLLGSGLIMMTPKLTHAEAVASMSPLTDFAASLGNVPFHNEVVTVPSFYQAYERYILPSEETVGIALALGSRLIPKDVFSTASGQRSMITALEKIANQISAVTGTASGPNPGSLAYGPPLQILVTAPSSYRDNDTVPASITPAWRSAIWHVVGAQAFPNNADVSTINRAFQTAHGVAKILEGVAPDSGAYQNEADVFQDNPIQTFWGRDNYNRLLGLKKQIDPKNVLTCWDCIGWDSEDARYGCYPAAPS